MFKILDIKAKGLFLLGLSAAGLFVLPLTWSRSAFGSGLNTKVVSQKKGVKSTMKTTNQKPGDDRYKKPSEDEIKQRLSPLQCQVTQEGATELPFHNEFWDNKKPGIYVDVVTGEPLFSSTDKYDSGSGWPSFTKPLVNENIKTKADRSLGMVRTEIRSGHGNSHLGHLFDDGPGPNHARYCVNSASLRFIPVEKLDQEGYGEFTNLFMSTASGLQNSHEAKGDGGSKVKTDTSVDTSKFPLTDFVKSVGPGLEVAVLAGGCFWGVEEIIRGLAGVKQVQVGYTGGSSEHPVYNDVHTGRTGHAEAVQIVFDPKKITYDQLLGWFFRLHDPTTMNSQGNDRGTQYRSAIFAYNGEQRSVAEAVKDRVNKSGKWKNPVVTEIVAAKPFWRAEEYHQDYLQKNPNGYTCHFIRD